MPDALRVGIVGCGNISRAHIRSYAKLSEAKMVAVCDVDAEAARTRAEETGATAYTDMGAMLAGEKLDAASVCTPPFLHREQVEALLGAGLHVLCEKPLSHRVEDARAMAKAAEDAGRILMTAFCWRFHGIRREIKRRIEAGMIGRVTLLTSHGGGLSKKLEGRWFGDPEKGGGVVREACVHMFDQIRWLAGEIRSVQARTATLGLEMAAEDTLLATFALDGGAYAVLGFSWGTPGAGSFTSVTGSEGTITALGSDEAVIRDADGEETERFKSESADRFGEEVAHFVRAARGEEPPEISPADGVRATEIAAAVIESARTGRAVEI